MTMVERCTNFRDSVLACVPSAAFDMRIKNGACYFKVRGINCENNKNKIKNAMKFEIVDEGVTYITYKVFNLSDCDDLES